MDWYDLAWKGFAVLGAGYAMYMVGGHGLPWVVGKVKGWFTAAKVDLVAVEARVTTLEKTIGIVKPVTATGATGA